MTCDWEYHIGAAPALLAVEKPLLQDKVHPLASFSSALPVEWYLHVPHRQNEHVDFYQVVNGRPSAASVSLENPLQAVLLVNHRDRLLRL